MSWFDGEDRVALLQGGAADIDEPDPDDWTALVYSAKQCYSRVARTLLNKGSTFPRRNMGVVSLLWTFPLTRGAGGGNQDASEGQCGPAGSKELSAGREAVSPPFLAAENGQSEVMSALIKAGAIIDCRNLDGATQLFVAAQTGHVDAVRMLVRAEANPLLVRIEGEYNIPPLDMAAQSRLAEVTRELIQ